MPYQDALKTIQSLVRSAETLAALGALCNSRAGADQPDGLIASKLEAVRDVIDPRLLDDVSAEEAQFLNLTVRANLRRALELVETPDQPAAWVFDDPVILQGQGKSSRAVTRLLSAYADRTPRLSQRLSENARFLDVGSGTGWISITMAERWPSLIVDGYDVHAPALELAEENLASSSVADRVHFHNCDIADLAELDLYTVAFIPVLFLPQTVVEAALPALYRAIVPGGWLFFGGFRVPEDPLLRALNDLQTTLFGGRVWAEEEASSLLARHGFNVIEDIGIGTPLSLVAARKP